MSKSPSVFDLREISKKLNLKFINKGKLPDEKADIIPIVNLKKRTLTVIDLTDFCSQHNKNWVTDVIGAPAPDEKEKEKLEAAQQVPKALLETGEDTGFGVVILEAVKKGKPVVTYEGRLIVDAKSTSRYILSCGKEGQIDGLTDTGWGPYMQSLPNKAELSCYRFTGEIKKEHVAEENILFIYKNKRAIGLAITDLEPLTQIGFSYKGHFWSKQPKDPVLFNKENGCPISITAYKITQYFIGYRTENFPADFYYEHLSEEKIKSKAFQSLAETKGSYCLQGTVAFKPDDFRSSLQKNSKSGLWVPKRIYSLIISNFAAMELLAIAQELMKTNDEVQMSAFEYVQFITKRLELAQILFLQAGESTLAKACRQQRLAFYEHAAGKGFLVQNSIGKEIPPEDLNTELRRAAASKAKTAVQAILELKADVNSAGSGSKKTALHYAVQDKNLEICKLLVEAKADLTAKDFKQKTPIKYLKTSGSPLYQLLKEATDSQQKKENLQSPKLSLSSS